MMKSEKASEDQQVGQGEQRSALRTARKLQQSRWNEKRGGWNEKKKRGQEEQLRPACEGLVMMKGVKSSE